MNLRSALKSYSQDLHDLIENQYPYNTLSSSVDIADNGQACLVCFKIVFFKFLDQMKGCHEFYQASYDALLNIAPELNDRLLNRESIKDVRHLQYVFLGSRHGNAVLLKRNPELIHIQGGSYFSSPLPRDLWQEFCDETIMVEDTAVIEYVTGEVRKTFSHLIDLGMSLESIKR